MRFAIVDDLGTERTLLKERLARQLRQRGTEAELLEFDSGEAFLAAEEAQRFTAAFLDIYMDGLSGMDAAKELRKKDADCLIISAEHFAHIINIRTTAGKTLAMRQSFKAFTEPLKKDPRFFVCGRGTIINMENAADFQDAAFCMTDGSQVYVSQELLKAARQAFMEFLLQRGRVG